MTDRSMQLGGSPPDGGAVLLDRIRGFQADGLMPFSVKRSVLEIADSETAAPRHNPTSLLRSRMKVGMESSGKERDRTRSSCFFRRQL